MEIVYNYQRMSLKKKKIRNDFILEIIRITFDPSIRYTVWSILLGGGLNATAVYSCLQTQAQRYLCVKNTRSAQKYRFLK